MLLVRFGNELSLVVEVGGDALDTDPKPSLNLLVRAEINLVVEVGDDALDRREIHLGLPK